MRKQLPILFSILFAIMTYSQNQVFIEKSGAQPSIGSDKNGLRLGEDGTLQIADTGSLKIFAGASLTVKNKITNHGDGENFIVESDGNLVQLENSAINSGNINVQRAVKISTERKQYNYMGTPVAFKAGQTFKTIYNGITYVLYYNEATNFFSNSSGVNIPGRGLAVKEPTLAGVPVAAQTTAIFKGVPQNGTITLPVTNKDINATTWGYNLVGNPYPSNIDLKVLYAINLGDPLNISASFYFWDNTNNTNYEQQGSGYNGQSYAVYNVLAGPDGTGLGSPSKINTKIPTNIVKVGQGFLTRALVGSHGFTFDNSIRSAETGETFLGRNAEAQSTDRYWLEITAPSEIKSSLAVVYYSQGNNLLGLEDSRSMGSSDEVFSLVEDQKISINGKSDFTDGDIVPLGTRHFTTGIYTLALGDQEGIFGTGQNIYLKDTQTGMMTNLSKGNYTFTATAGESTGRFEIVYKPESVLVTDTITQEEITVYRDAQDFVIKAQTKKISDIEVYDATGRLTFKVQPNQTKVIIPAEKFVRGVYILKIVQDGQITTKKIIR